MTNIAKIAKITNVTKFYIDVEKGETKKGPEMSGNIAQVILVTFAIFAKFGDLLKPFLTFSVSKCRIL